VDRECTDGGATIDDRAGARLSTLKFTTKADQNGFRYRAIFTNAVGRAVTIDVGKVLF
jgi:hypothetical protein